MLLPSILLLDFVAWFLFLLGPPFKRGVVSGFNNILQLWMLPSQSYREVI